MLSSLSTLKFTQSLLKTFVLQFLLMGAISIALSLWNSLFGLSFGLGAAIPWIANGVFAYIVLQNKQMNCAKASLRRFYGGEVVKLLVTGLCFWACFQWKEIAVAGLFVGFIAAQVFYFYRLFLHKII
jgi:F0F1-type ATP synthase assembly protein I